MKRMTENLSLPSLSFFERIQLYLYDDNSKIPLHHQFTDKQLVIKKRYSTAFSYWIDKPTLSDKKVASFIVNEFGISPIQAYRDLIKVKILLGNVRNASKEWQRFKVIAMLDRAYELAERTKDPKSIILAADKLGKYTMLDKEDIQKIPYDEIVPQNWEITGDVTVMGLKPIDDLEAKQKKMREKYGGTLIEEAVLLDEEK